MKVSHSQLTRETALSHHPPSVARVKVCELICACNEWHHQLRALSLPYLPSFFLPSSFLVVRCRFLEHSQWCDGRRKIRISSDDRVSVRISVRPSVEAAKLAVAAGAANLRAAEAEGTNYGVTVIKLLSALSARSVDRRILRPPSSIVG